MQYIYFPSNLSEILFLSLSLSLSLSYCNSFLIILFFFNFFQVPHSWIIIFAIIWIPSILQFNLKVMIVESQYIYIFLFTWIKKNIYDIIIYYFIFHLCRIFFFTYQISKYILFYSNFGSSINLSILSLLFIYIKTNMCTNMESTKKKKLFNLFCVTYKFMFMCNCILMFMLLS